MTLLNIFLDLMKNHFEQKYDKSNEEFSKKFEGYKVYRAHELCRCPKMNELEELFPDVAKTKRYEPAIILGELVHIAMETLMKGHIQTEDEIKLFYKVFEDIKTVVIGTPDAIYNGHPVDYKFQRFPPKEIKEHHLLRIRLYMWLMDVDVGYVIYITPMKILQFEVSGSLNDSDVLALINNPVSPRWRWECKLCPFRKICELSVGGGEADEGSAEAD